MENNDKYDVDQHFAKIYEERLEITKKDYESIRTKLLGKKFGADVVDILDQYKTEEIQEIENRLAEFRKPRKPR